MSEKFYDVIIIGGAAAGLTAAIYTSRQGLKTLVVTKDIGGQALLAPHIENYPGFKSISGFELMQIFYQQAESFGSEFVYEEVKEVGKIDGNFYVKTFHGNVYTSKALILAFGKTPLEMGVPGEDKFVGKGVSYCATCDGPLFKDKVVAVVGFGEPAIDAALLLSRIASKVYLITKGSRLVGDEELIKRCMNEEKVTLMLNTEVMEIKGEKRVESLTLKNTKTSTIDELKVDGVFVELGYTAKTDFIRGFVEVNESGEIIVDKNQATSCPGVFAAGDVTDAPFKQLIISAGDGAKAGLAAYNYIQRLRGKPTKRADWRKF
ncbi:MAG: FAD-dependent oxidoreductase [Nitrososphaerota archaeon]|nr:FAD-dependent oxidoreductase [Nitrososphaerales archaeon]MDW8044476.1 FAD-dependent oxidoreductase [Nitrososphaerota archaeon]